MAVTLLARRPLSGSSCAANVSCKPTLAMAAVPRAAPWRLALREALLLCMFRRQLWNAPATVRACRAASPPIASRSFWICQTSSAAGAVRMRSRIGLMPATMDSLMGALLEGCNFVHMISYLAIPYMQGGRDELPQPAEADVRRLLRGGRQYGQQR